MKFNKLILLLFLLSAILSACDKPQKDYWGDTDSGLDETVAKPCYIWVDASANFPDFANSKENIARDLALAKDAGFTDIVVDVRPTTGDVLFKTNVVDQVKYQYAWVNGVYSRVERTADWDYLQAFIDEGRKLDLRVHAAINTFVGGYNINGGTGLLYRDKTKRDWATYVSTLSGIKNIMDVAEGTKFFNPGNEDVQKFLCDLLKDLAMYDLDGIVLDRGRFLDLRSDFSEDTRRKFESYLGGVSIGNFPEDILPLGAEFLPEQRPQYLLKWLEFRAKTIYDFMNRAEKAVKSVNGDLKFGVYVGGWYSSYYTVGVNWASSSYNTSNYYNWASSDYKKYGYAGIMDHILIGAYASPFNVYGSTEWTMAGFSYLAQDKIGAACPLVVSGPDVGNWDMSNIATPEQENQAIINSVEACMDACGGYFLFDMIHLKMADQWEYAKQGINQARK